MQWKRTTNLSVNRIVRIVPALIFFLIITTGFACKETADAQSPKSNHQKCLERALFGKPDNSEYILPFPVGSAFLCSQSYCYSRGGHRGQLAVDFDMPIGTPIIATRGGIVKAVKDDSPDNGQGEGDHNYILIEHSDGSVAFYGHMQQHCVSVQVGDQVEAGSAIGYSGNSGLSSGPHLHFGVYKFWPPIEGHDLPVNFRNTDGPLDQKGGLIMGETYMALPD